MKNLNLDRFPHRLQLSLTLAPAFWLILLWVYYLSPQNKVIPLVEAVAYMLAISFTCAYCVTLFVAALRKSSMRSGD
jgi:hypothetical protein